MKYSLHIATNETDQSAYPEPFEDLSACINDAQAFEAIAKHEGFATSRLYDSEATAGAVIQALEQLAKCMSANDLLFVTYSGHGSQRNDRDRDEPNDDLDETWVVYDRQLIDDELWLAWSAFERGVHIFLVSDSCNSGTILRRSREQNWLEAEHPGSAHSNLRSRRMPPRARTRDFAVRHQVYSDALANVPRSDSVSVQASLMLYAACQDGEDASEVGQHGVLTQAFLDSWGEGTFEGGYFDLFHRIHQQVTSYGRQTPNYLTLGLEDFEFESRRPLSA